MKRVWFLAGEYTGITPNGKPADVWFSPVGIEYKIEPQLNVKGE